MPLHFEEMLKLEIRPKSSRKNCSIDRSPPREKGTEDLPPFDFQLERTMPIYVTGWARGGSRQSLDLDPHEFQSSAQEVAPLCRDFLLSHFPLQL